MDPVVELSQSESGPVSHRSFVNMAQVCVILMHILLYFLAEENHPTSQDVNFLHATRNVKTKQDKVTCVFVS